MEEPESVNCLSFLVKLEPELNGAEARAGDVSIDGVFGTAKDLSFFPLFRASLSRSFLLFLRSFERVLPVIK